MAFDGITTYHLVKELNLRLSGGHVRKIYQPEVDEIHLSINNKQQNDVLLISTNANNPRVHLTKRKKPNPNTPPSFCMVLRKHLTNATVAGIRQHESDRVILIDFNTKNDFGDPVVKTLVCEIMGRHSNIILLNEENDTEPTIIDSLKKIGSATSRYRQILPGLAYKFPPEAGRTNYFDCEDASAFDAWLTAHEKSTLSHEFVQGFLGISPGLAQEICFRAGVDAKTEIKTLTHKQRGFLTDAFLEIQREILSGPVPTLYYFHHNVQSFSTVDYHYLSDLDSRHPETVSELLEDFYYEKDKKVRFTTKSANLKHQLNNLYKKDSKKLQNLNADLKKSMKADKQKKYGDLVTANIYQIEKGMKSITVPDYTDPEQKPVTIPLKVNETPSQNAQRFYKKYNKAKRAQVQLAEQIKQTKEAVYYLESLLNALDQCTEPEELDEIRHEVAHSEFGKKGRRGHHKNSKKPKPSKPMHFKSSEGFDILVGKNNYQNDDIATRLGHDEDCWLHVQDIPGSHVLVIANGRFITEQTLLEAGALAAYYSKARSGSLVPVDYVEYRYLHKPNKSKPGFVTFTHQNTMYVTPKKEVIDGLEVVREK